MLFVLYLINAIYFVFELTLNVLIILQFTIKIHYMHWCHS